MKQTIHQERKSYRNWRKQGQQNGTLTKRQRAQSMADKDRHQRKLTRAFAMRGNPPVIARPFTHMKYPTVLTDVLDLRHPNGKPKYIRRRNGSIVKNPL